MAKLKALFYYIFKKRKIIEEIKPNLVFWYIEFSGDQKKIQKAMDTNYGIENKKHYNEVMKDVNLDDYLVILEKGFTDYIIADEVTYIIKKSDYVKQVK